MIRFSTTEPDAIYPIRKHDTDAGIDLYPLDPDGVGINIPAGEIKIVRTGITIEIPAGFAGLVWPKSGTDILIGGGVIDFGYQGEIFIKIINPLKTDYFFKPGKAIAQLVIQPIYPGKLEYTPPEGLHKVRSERGTTGGIVSQVEILNGPTEF